MSKSGRQQPDWSRPVHQKPSLTVAISATILALGLVAVLLWPGGKATPTVAPPNAAPSPTPAPTAAPAPTATPASTSPWPELSRLDEMLHDAAFFCKDEDAESLRPLFPKLETALAAVSSGDAPRLPGADPAWVKRRQQDLRNARPKPLDVAALSDKELYAAVDAIVPYVEIMMSATDLRHIPLYGGQVGWLKPAVPAGLPMAETPRPGT